LGQIYDGWILWMVSGNIAVNAHLRVRAI